MGFARQRLSGEMIGSCVEGVVAFGEGPIHV
jgi:hypothetical protein